MPSKTLTRAKLCKAVSQKTNKSQVQSSALVESILDEICDSLINGDSVKLSAFGSFLVRSKNERIGRNPKTGEKTTISSRRVIMFKPSRILKQTITASHIKK